MATPEEIHLGQTVYFYQEHGDPPQKILFQGTVDAAYRGMVKLVHVKDTKSSVSDRDPIYVRIPYVHVRPPSPSTPSLLEWKKDFSARILTRKELEEI